MRNVGNEHVGKENAIEWFLEARLRTFFKSTLHGLTAKVREILEKWHSLQSIPAKGRFGKMGCFPGLLWVFWCDSQLQSLSLSKTG